MDAVAALLDGPRAQNAFLLCSLLEPPWSIHIEDEAPLTVIAVVRGQAWLLTAASAILLGPGDTAIMRGPEHYTVSDAIDTDVQAVIGPGQVCTTPDGTELKLMGDLGVRTWGNDAVASTMMLTGTYQMDGEVGRRLLRALPSTVVVRASEWKSPLIPLLADEIVKDEPGQDAVLDRLLDLLLIAVLRAWFARSDAAAPGWYQAHSDPVVGSALRVMHAAPAEPWTVATLAREVGASRAAFARRFTELVGEPPMTYLTGWRLDLAADLLREPDSALSSVATRVGYSTPFALSAAFKRERGISPRQYRTAARGAVG
jgi:AraC-like DNA-binding protein